MSEGWTGFLTGAGIVGFIAFWAGFAVCAWLSAAKEADQWADDRLEELRFGSDS